jgi:hypothetical protein
LVQLADFPCLHHSIATDGGGRRIHNTLTLRITGPRSVRTRRSRRITLLADSGFHYTIAANIKANISVEVGSTIFIEGK